MLRSHGQRSSSVSGARPPSSRRWPRGGSRRPRRTPSPGPSRAPWPRSSCRPGHPHHDDLLHPDAVTDRDATRRAAVGRPRRGDRPRWAGMERLRAVRGAGTTVTRWPSTRRDGRRLAAGRWPARFPLAPELLLARDGADRDDVRRPRTREAPLRAVGSWADVAGPADVLDASGATVRCSTAGPDPPPRRPEWFAARWRAEVDAWVDATASPAGPSAYRGRGPGEGVEPVGRAPGARPTRGRVSSRQPAISSGPNPASPRCWPAVPGRVPELLAIRAGAGLAADGAAGRGCPTRTTRSRLAHRQRRRWRSCRSSRVAHLAAAARGRAPRPRSRPHLAAYRDAGESPELRMLHDDERGSGARGHARDRTRGSAELAA